MYAKSSVHLPTPPTPLPQFNTVGVTEPTSQLLPELDLPEPLLTGLSSMTVDPFVDLTTEMGVVFNFKKEPAFDETGFKL
ncbi:hypothetical protein G9A89_014843 [Geosiphon pyriformis]|nr:hypothetical protein G9A89_014843 [Geosiphon pyriformis]